MAVGTRGGVSRSVRGDECSRREVDADAAGGAGCDLCVAALASEGVFYQAEAYLSLGTASLRTFTRGL